jgi:hypothetical protein
VPLWGVFLKNNNDQEGLKHWDIIQNDGEGFGSGFYNNSVNKGFNTSYGWNIKEQTIEVQSFGTLVGRFPVENRLTMLCASSFNSTSRNR